VGALDAMKKCLSSGMLAVSRRGRAGKRFGRISRSTVGFVKVIKLTGSSIGCTISQTKQLVAMEV